MTGQDTDAYIKIHKQMDYRGLKDIMADISREVGCWIDLTHNEHQGICGSIKTANRAVPFNAMIRRTEDSELVEGINFYTNGATEEDRGLVDKVKKATRIRLKGAENDS